MKLKAGRQAADLIRTAMERAGIRSSDLAGRLNVSRPAVSNLLHRGDNLTVGRLEAVLRACGFNLKLQIAKKKARAK